MSGPTLWPPLNQAIAQISGTLPHPITWVSPLNDSHWGTTSFGDRTIYVSHAVPLDKLYSVVIHEWSHMKSTDVYGGDLVTAFGRFRSVFGGSSADGVEVVADCMAILRGASWTYYTSCNNSAWRVAANKLLNGQKI